MTEQFTRDPEKLDIPLHHLTAAYSAYHQLDTNHTYEYALDLARKLAPLNCNIEPGWTTLTVTGVMLITMKLETARAMGRLRRPDGQTSYRGAGRAAQ